MSFTYTGIFASLFTNGIAIIIGFAIRDAARSVFSHFSRPEYEPSTEEELHMMYFEIGWAALSLVVGSGIIMVFKNNGTKPLSL